MQTSRPLHNPSLKSLAAAPARVMDAGYTLLEVLIALTIIALAATVVAPGLSSSVGQASRKAAELEFQSSIVDLRRQAVRAQQIVRTRAAAPANVIKAKAKETETANNAYTLTADLPAPRGWIVEPAEVMFFPDGSCSETRLVMRNPLGTELRVGITSTCRLKP
jgi:prepilin-type N-terminal cleavage/methylation domain-containing protein